MPETDSKKSNLDDASERSEAPMRYDCDVKSTHGPTNYCHPSEVLRALSEARLDDTVDPVSRNAVVAVDVGDVTLVRRTFGIRVFGKDLLLVVLMCDLFRMATRFIIFYTSGHRFVSRFAAVHEPCIQNALERWVMDSTQGLRLFWLSRHLLLLLFSLATVVSK